MSGLDILVVPSGWCENAPQFNGLLERLRGITPVKTVAQYAAEMEERYASLLRGRAGLRTHS